MQEQTMPSTATPFETNPDEIQNHESAKNWTKPIVFFLVGVLLAAGLVFAGINIGKNQQSEQQPVLAQPTALPTVIATNPTALPSPTAEANLTIDPAASPTSTDTTGQRAGWKVYTSQDLRFSIQYPNNWSVSEFKLENKIESVELSDSKIGSISIYKGGFADGTDNPNIRFDYEDTFISSLPARIQYVYQGDKLSSKAYQVTIGKVPLVLQFSPAENTNESYALFDKIVFSIKNQ